MENTQELIGILQAISIVAKSLAAKLMRMVCNMEIWCECFGRDSSTLKKIDSYEISGILRKIEGWGKYTVTKNGMSNFPIYGKQRAYVREQAEK